MKRLVFVVMLAACGEPTPEPTETPRQVEAPMPAAVVTETTATPPVPVHVPVPVPGRDPRPQAAEPASPADTTPAEDWEWPNC